MIPRIVTADEWKKLSKGIEQRVRAINAFLHDLYHKREIVKAGKLPERVLAQNEAFLPQMVGSRRRARSTPISSASIWCAPGPMSSWCWRTMRARPRRLYMLENRETMMAMFPELFTKVRCSRFRTIRAPGPQLAACAPPAASGHRPVVAVLTPGIYNSAYFEHAFLADQMGAELVEAAICAWSMAASACAPRAGGRRSTCSIAGWTTISSIR
jgi:uncharacterized circularly permuted ATP-grasp superfamily protein